MLRQPETDRRRADRFPANCQLRYRNAANKNTWDGTGRTVNISSTGLLFRAKSSLPVGMPVEVSVMWPAKLDDAQFLKLEATGRVIRSHQGEAAIEIERCEFQDAGASGLRLCK